MRDFMRLHWLNLLFVLASIVEAIRTRRTGWWDLGFLFYVRTFYSPESLGLGVDFTFSSLDDFELAIDLGPITVAGGRDFTGAL